MVRDCKDKPSSAIITMLNEARAWETVEVVDRSQAPVPRQLNRRCFLLSTPCSNMASDSSAVRGAILSEGMMDRGQRMTFAIL